jgi:hypothetical protein
MTNPELESILKKARPPEIPAASLEMFPRLIMARLKRIGPESRATSNLSPRLAWVFGLVACVAIALAIMRSPIGHMVNLPPRAADSLASLKLVREMVAMFPHRVRAIVEDDRGLNLVLSDNDDVPTSAPLYVHICDGKHCSSVVPFSGQEIDVGGQKITVLDDPRGEIIVEGNQFVWSSAQEFGGRSHLRIDAKELEKTM